MRGYSPVINCACCSKPTNNPRFCSKSCSAKVTNREYAKRKMKERLCKKCGCTLDYDKIRKVCDACLIPEDKTIEQAIYTKHHKSSAFALIRTRARSVTKDRPQTCVNCGYDKHVEVCHIKPISSYSLDTLVSIVNSPNNLVLLCPNCHWEYDKGRLALSN